MLHEQFPAIPLHVQGLPKITICVEILRGGNKPRPSGLHSISTAEAVCSFESEEE
jgi:hypothetical protein